MISKVEMAKKKKLLLMEKNIFFCVNIQKINKKFCFKNFMIKLIN